MDILKPQLDESINGDNNNQETTDNEQTKTSDDNSKYLKRISQKISEDIEDEDNNEPFVIKIKEYQNTCSEEYALNNENYNKEENLVIDLLFNNEYDLNNDGKITETEIELAKTILKSYDDNKSILDLILENINTCSTTYYRAHRYTYEQEGLTYVANNFNDEYDLNKDGKITTEDYNFAKDIIQRNNKLKKLQNETLINALSSLPELPDSISDSLDSIMDALNTKLKLTSVNAKNLNTNLKNIQNIENINTFSDAALKDFETYYINTCSKEYARNNPNYKQEGLKVINNFDDASVYDINNDGKITKEDFLLALSSKSKQLNFIDILYDISLSLQNIIANLNDQSYLANKNLYFREAVMRLVMNKEWVENDIQFKYLIQSCIKKANMLADEVFKNT